MTAAAPRLPTVTAHCPVQSKSNASPAAREWAGRAATRPAEWGQQGSNPAGETPAPSFPITQHWAAAAAQPLTLINGQRLRVVVLAVRSFDHVLTDGQAGCLHGLFLCPSQRQLLQGKQQHGARCAQTCRAHTLFWVQAAVKLKTVLGPFHPDCCGFTQPGAGSSTTRGKTDGGTRVMCQTKAAAALVLPKGHLCPHVGTGPWHLWVPTGCYPPCECFHPPGPRGRTLYLGQYLRGLETREALESPLYDSTILPHCAGETPPGESCGHGGPGRRGRLRLQGQGIRHGAPETPLPAAFNAVCSHTWPIWSR